MSTAGWIQVTPPYSMGAGSTATPIWAAVDVDGEILATVSGSGNWWQAAVMQQPGGFGTAKSGAFISEDKAKLAVEKWLAPLTFVAQNTWVYKVNPP